MAVILKWIIYPIPSHPACHPVGAPARGEGIYKMGLSTMRELFSGILAVSEKLFMKKSPRFTINLILFIALFPVYANGASSSLSALSEQDEWMGIYFGDKKLGFSHTTVTLSDRAVKLKSRVFMRFHTGRVDQVTSFSQETHLTRDLKVKRFTLLQEIAGTRQEIEGRPIGKKMILDVSTRGYRKRRTVPIPDGTVFGGTYLFDIIKKGLRVGEKGTLSMFLEPMQMVVPLKYEVVQEEFLPYKGKTVKTFVLRQDVAGMESTLWVTPEGNMVRERSSQGFETRVEPREIAQKLDGEAMAVSSFITLSLVKPQRKISGPDRRKRIKLKIMNLRSPDAIPQDHRQKVLKVETLAERSYAATVTIQTESARKGQSASLPINGFKNKELLSDSSEIQSQHPQIRVLAREIVGREKDSWQAAKKIHEWVYKNMKKELVDNVTALDALRTRRGECQSHTNLFTAIARATGIPTKIVVGLVYSKHFQGFVYHAWPQVFVGEWRALDPTLGQENVDATHIKLGEGIHQGPLQLMEFVGRVNIEVL